MKILIHTGCISKNGILMQSYVILPDISYFIQPALNVIKIIGDPPIVTMTGCLQNFTLAHLGLQIL